MEEALRLSMYSPHGYAAHHHARVGGREGGKKGIFHARGCGLVAELVEERGDGVLAAGEASADNGSEPRDHCQAAVVELLVLVGQRLLLGLLIELGEGGGVGLHIPGDLVLLLGGKHLEGGREQEHLRPALSGPSTGGDSANAEGHGLGDPVAGGHEARQLHAKAGHQGVEHGKHGNCEKERGKMGEEGKSERGVRVCWGGGRREGKTKKRCVTRRGV